MFKRAFTLVELLLTIAVLAILVAVLVPIYNSAILYTQGKAAATKGAIIEGAKQLYMGDVGATAVTQWSTIPSGMDATTYQYGLLQPYLGGSYSVLNFASFAHANPTGYGYSFGPTLSSPVRVYFGPVYIGNTPPGGAAPGAFWVDTSATQTQPSVKTFEYQAYVWQPSSWLPVDASAPPCVYPR